MRSSLTTVISTKRRNRYAFVAAECDTPSAGSLARHSRINSVSSFPSGMPPIHGSMCGHSSHRYSSIVAGRILMRDEADRAEGRPMAARPPSG
jgi:hypothetical protein